MEIQVSDQTTELSDAPLKTNQTTSQESESDVVKYETYKRTLGEAKKAKSEVEQLRDRLTQLEQEKLSLEGNKDQLIDTLKGERDQLKQKLTTAVGSFARSKVNEVLISEMAKAGCQDAELLLRAYEQEISDVEFDEKFNPNRDQVKAFVESIKSERPYLFGKSGPKLASHQPRTDVDTEKPVKPLSKMSQEELFDLWSKTEGAR